VHASGCVGIAGQAKHAFDVTSSGEQELVIYVTDVPFDPRPPLTSVVSFGTMSVLLQLLLD
jgi:hypothetical protein